MHDDCLLIHNDNSMLKDNFSNQVYFNLENRENPNLDKYITNFILPKIKDKNLKCIIIREKLSLNGLDFYGLILLLHIRLSLDLNDDRFLPIVVESNLPIDLICRISSLFHVLFTESVYFYTSEEIKEKIEKLKNIPSKLSRDNFKELFINKISIEMPRDYLSKHSIANEWSIFKWAHILNINDVAINRIIDEMNSILYFKYLRNKFYQSDIEPNPDLLFKNNNKARILYIDDESKKGWNQIFNEMFAGMIYESIGDDFKEKDSRTIIDTSIEKIKNFKPDIVLLDLRLSDSDFEEKNIEELTGSIILKEIKDYNPGIQCIMFTATSRSIYLDYLNKKGILGFIKKESPEDSIISTEDNIKSLNNILKVGIKNKYLVEVYNLLKEMKNKLGTSLLDLNSDEIEILKINIDFLFSVLNSNANNRVNYAMLTIFKCFECLKDALTDVVSQKVYRKELGVRLSTHSILNIGMGNSYTATRNRLHIILIEKLGFPASSEEYKEIDYIVDVRNPYIHPKSPSEFTDTIESGILLWVKLLKKFIDGLN